MILDKEDLGGPWHWPLVREICEDIMGPAGDPQQWVMGGHDGQIVISGPAVDGREVALQDAIELHVLEGPASWAEQAKDETATSLNDGRPLRIAIARAMLELHNEARAAIGGLAPVTVADFKAMVRGFL